MSPAPTPARPPGLDDKLAEWRERAEYASENGWCVNYGPPEPDEFLALLDRLAETQGYLALLQDSKLHARMEAAEARAAEAERLLDEAREARNAAILEMSACARAKGEAEGKLMMSERERDAARAQVGRLAELVQCLVDNDPDEPIADGGHVVLDLWRHDAIRALASLRASRELSE